ncbi:NifB/NifX family molybdenum-iron cluster-binding protein [Megasphaera sp.]|uniref:NifB/NifX family molybdenum-iron cluster-binding protein n=1 Tax=Megasphaera sp. TaxID=2023260 RepID=UPI003520F084
MMRVAVTYENGNVFQHFGHSEKFKIYDVEDGHIVKADVIDTNGQGHGLQAQEVNAVIAGGIGGGAQQALAAASIDLYGGVTGSADEAVKDLLNGTLKFNPDVACSHHDQQHGYGEHHCGSHGCGGHQ